MASRFLDRTKRWSPVSLLLLFGRRRKAIVALVVVFLLMLVFMTPGNGAGLLAFWPRWLAAAPTVSGPLMKGKFEPIQRRFTRLAEQFSRNQSRRLAAADRSLRPVPPTEAVDSTRFLRGGVERPTTIAGIVRAEEARELPRGVDVAGLDESSRDAVAGHPALSATQAANRALKVLGQRAPYAGPGFFSGPAPRAADSDEAALAPEAPAPEALRKTAGRGSALSKAPANSPRPRPAAGGGIVNVLNHKSIRQLGYAHARAKVSREPGCSSTSGCPAEFASAHSGISYDGNNMGGMSPAILVAAAVDGIDSAAAPDSDEQKEIESSEQLLADAQACQQADTDYTETENELNAKLWDLQDKMSSQDCQDFTFNPKKVFAKTSILVQIWCALGIGDCDQAKACKKLAKRWLKTCHALNDTITKHYNACPVNTNPTYEPDLAAAGKYKPPLKGCEF